MGEQGLPFQAKLGSYRKTVSYAHRRTNEHSHRMWQADLFLTGSAVVQTPGSEITAVKNQIVVVSPLTKHSFSYMEKTRFLSVRFSISAGEEQFRGAFLGIHCIDLLRESSSFVTALLSLPSPSRPLPALRRTLANYSLSALLYTVIESRKHTAASSDRPSSMATAIAEYIQQNSHRNPKVADLERKFDVSRVRMNAAFSDAYGMSVKNYIQQNRLQTAVQHLFAGSSSFTETANWLGFRDVHDFSRFIKKYTGLNPGQIRKGESNQILSDLLANGHPPIT